MKPFIGTCQLSEAEFREVLERLATPPSYYFLRWFDSVSGFINQFPERLSPEGQMFNTERELRWKRQGDSFNVLLLSSNGAEEGFTPVGETWEIRQHQAHVYPATETRFPKTIAAGNVNVEQRYFIDAQTATVQFVALTVSK